MLSLHYYPENDSLRVELKANASTDSREIGEGLTADFDAAGNVVALEIQYASKRWEL